MPSENCKGIVGLYDEVIDIFSTPGKVITFFEWMFPWDGKLQAGQLCYSVISYFKRKRWVLEECEYKSTDEENSTWYARDQISRLPNKSCTGIVKKYFDLENGEDLVTINCKIRPIILISKVTNNWWNPANLTDSVESWLCLPLFSYKDRHFQEYVLNDERLNTNRFYIPRFYKNRPGVDIECAGVFDSMQNILTDNVKPLRRYSIDHNMSIPYKLSEQALKIITYHYNINNNLLHCYENVKTEYDIFKEAVNEIIDSTMKS